MFSTSLNFPPDFVFSQEVWYVEEGRHLPVAASMIKRRVVMRPKIRIAMERTVRVGHLLTKGAIRMAPTH